MSNLIVNRKVLIAYERKSREFECCLIIKNILDKSGYECKITHFLDSDNFKYSNKINYHCLIVPHLYTDDSVYRNICRFGRFEYIINMQYEQVLSEKWELLGHHNPQGLAQRGIHICWGDVTKNRLIASGVHPKNCVVTGAIQMDFLRPEFRIDPNIIKNKLGSLHGLNVNVEWTLFLSSFTYADISDQRLKINERVAGIKLDDIVPYFTNSRVALLNWFSVLLKKDSESIFIYRPHPDELNLEPVQKLAIKYKNFHIIKDGPAKAWIESSDKLYTWYSTTVVEAQLLDKKCAILRPFPLPLDFDSVLLKKGDFITNMDEFLEMHFTVNGQKQQAIKMQYVQEYYKKTEKPAFESLLDVISNFSMYENFSTIKIPVKVMILNLFKNITIAFINNIYKLNIIKIEDKSLGNNNGFITQWLLEMDNQFYSKEEFFALNLDVIERLKKEGGI